MRDNKVQAVTRAIDLLKLITAHPQGIGVVALARQAHLHKSTVSRLLTTLEAAGAIRRTAKRSDVQIAPDFANRFLSLSSPNTLIAVARPFLQALSLRFGEAAGLAVPDGDQAHYIDQVSPDTAIQVRDWTGHRFLLHAVSAGKVFLAHHSPEEQDRYLAQPLAAYTQNTKTDSKTVRDSLQEVHHSGVAWIFDEFADGLSGVAAPIVNQHQTVIAALGLYGPSYRFPGETDIEQINMLVIDYAKQCGSQLQTFSDNEGD